MSFADLPVSGFLEQVAGRQSAPAGGSVAASTVAAAAALVGMAARFSSEAFADVAERGDMLRARASTLADRDAAAYATVLEARRLPEDHPERQGRVAEALGRAADVPLEVAETACEVAELGAQLARDGNPNLQGDAVTAVLLADGAARSAAQLVRINVRAGDLGEERTARAAAACARLAEAVRTVEAKA